MIGCTRLFRVFGMHYFSVADVFDKTKRSPTWKATLYLVFLLFLVTNNNFGGLLMRTMFQSSEFSLNDLFDFGINAASLFISASVLILSFISTSDQKQIFVNFEEISMLFLYRLDQKVDFSIFKNRFFRDLWNIFVFFAFFVLLIGFMEAKSDSLVEVLILAAILMASMAVLIFSGILFVFYVDLLSFNLKYLDRSFKDISSNISTVILVKLKASEIFNVQSSYKKLAAIKMIHLRIWETTELINKAIGKQILLYVVMMVIGTTLGFYKTFLKISAQNDIIRVIVSILSNVQSIATLWIIVQSTYSVEKLVSFSENLKTISY